ncbi:hypothetical protein D3C71_805610 [compost metagenome]
MLSTAAANQLLGPLRQQRRTRRQKHLTRHARQRHRQTHGTQHLQHFARAFIHPQLRLLRGEIVMHLRLTGRHISRTQRFGNAPVLVVVTVGDRLRHFTAIASTTFQEAIRLGDMHPGQQLRIIGRVLTAIRQTPHHLRMNALDPRDQLVDFSARRVTGAGHETGGATQAPDQVFAEVGMVIHAGQRARVQQLQHQRAQATGQHAGEFGMNAPGDAVRAEPARVTRRRVIVHTALIAGESIKDPAPDLGGGGIGNTTGQGRHGRYRTVVGAQLASHLGRRPVAAAPATVPGPCIARNVQAQHNFQPTFFHSATCAMLRRRNSVDAARSPVTASACLRAPPIAKRSESARTKAA